MKQSTKNQYDDDLTLGNDEYDDSYYSDADDLFEFSTDDESPISRLKSLVLSIDWEITDEVLLQFNEELLDLKGIWARETINLVYVQALEKISKYIYQNKADSHPNAIKLLLTFYYNLEKIVSSEDLSEEQRKDILLEDVKKFENLKRQIKQKPLSIPTTLEPQRPKPQKNNKEVSGEDELLNLKAIVLGIDWEITDHDLNELRREVFRLEEKFSESKPKLILLQGIGTLAAYVKVKKSNAHPDAFKVMQIFYDSLEKIVKKPMSLEAEKAILFPAVEKFNSFKSLLGPTISPDAIIKKDDDEAVEEYGPSNAASVLSPALADVSEEEQIGFQAEKEAMAMGLKDSGGVASHIEDFFGESPSNQLFSETVAVEPKIIEEISDAFVFTEDTIVTPVEKNLALQGVDVESDDEEGLENEGIAEKDIFEPIDLEETAITEDEIDALLTAPALMDEVEAQGEVGDTLNVTEDKIVGATETLFPVDDGPNLSKPADANVSLDREKALQGVDVETEADDDTDEVSLPMEGEELAPALAAMEEESLFSATTLDRAPTSSSVTEEIVGTIDGLFLDHDAIPVVLGLGDLTEEEPIGGTIKEEANDEEQIDFKDWLKEDSTEGEPLSEKVVAETSLAADKQPTFAEADESDPVFRGDGAENELAAEEFAGDQDEENLSSFFSDSDLEQSSKDGSEIDALFDSLETDLEEERGDEAAREVFSNVKAIVDSEKDLKKTLEEELAFVLPENKGEDSVEEQVNVPIFDVQSVEDEVVFELFEEEIQQPVIVDHLADEENELSVDRIDIATDESLITGLEEATDNEIFEDWADGSIGVVEEKKNFGPLDNLQTCIHSLQIELSETIIVGLFQEINDLRQKWADKPLEKTFLQLLSTITQHIDSYRYESSAEAHGLLVSICQAMSNLKDHDLQANQEMLLSESLKVLEWQQGMLSRQAVKKGDQLSFTDPVRAEKEDDYQSDAQKDFDDHLDHYEDSAPHDMSYDHDLHGENVAGVGFPPSANEEITVKEEKVVEGDGELIRGTFADDPKKEIAALRQTLQVEIAELRRELRKD
ncbi:MAG: hypothetical protein KJ630_13470 [Proteobacteria bacterium]|nr:hypothetical protein [Pseudomonadota bacterium]